MFANNVTCLLLLLFVGRFRMCVLNLSVIGNQPFCEVTKGADTSSPRLAATVPARCLVSLQRLTDSPLPRLLVSFVFWSLSKLVSQSLGSKIVMVEEGGLF